MRIPINVVVSPHMDITEENYFETLVDDLLNKHVSVFEKVEKKLKKQIRKQKQIYDLKHDSGELSVAIQVMIEYSAQKGRKGGKLQEKYGGNYTISENLGKGLYRVKNESGKALQKKINISRLKVCRKRVECSATKKEQNQKRIKVIAFQFCFCLVKVACYTYSTGLLNN